MTTKNDKIDQHSENEQQLEITSPEDFNGDDFDEHSVDENNDDLDRRSKPRNQVTVMGRIKTNAVGSEIITCKVPMGVFGKLLCIINVPDEGRERAPCYFRFIPNDQNKR